MSAAGTDDNQRSAGPVLAGVRVLDLTQVVSGPVATMLLADLGAEVIKVEPPNGDVYRTSGPKVTGAGGSSSLNFMRFSRNKRSVVLNLKSPEGAAVLRQLVECSDVLVENFRPGALERLGFDPEELSRINPRLVYASISGYGHDDVVPSSHGDLPAYALIVEAMAGITNLAGEAGQRPAWMGFAMADIFAGVLAVAGILAALLDLRETGRARRVDIAMADGALLMNELAMLSYSALGEVLARGKYAYQAPWGMFRTADGYVAISVMTPQQWSALCVVAGSPELADDPRLQTGTDRSQHVEDLIRPAVEGWSGGLPTDQVVAALAAASVPAARVNSSADLIDDPGFARREMLVDIVDPVAGTVRGVGNPIKIGGAPPPRPGRIPGLGEHTDEVLAEVLGYDQARLDALRAAAAIG